MTRVTSHQYVEDATRSAQFRRLADGSYVGRVPGLKGVLAFGDDEPACRVELLSVLEGWVEVRNKLGLSLPAFANLGNSGHKNTARDMEELVSAEWQA